MPVVDRDGVGLHHVDLGEDGPRVVMLHGLLLGNVATWYFTAAPALAVGHRVRLYDLRGHGRSGRPATGYTIADHLGDLDVMAGDGPVSLVGHSFGAVVALRWALANPGRVERLVLVDPPLPPTAPSEVSAFLQRPPEEMADALPEGLKAALIGGRRQAQKLVGGLLALVQGTSIVDDTLGTPAFIADELVALAVPTLVVTGSASSCAAGAAWLASSLADGRLVTLQGGHYLHVDAPDALTAAIVGFFGGERG